MKRSFFFIIIALVSHFASAQVAPAAVDVAPLLIGEKIPEVSITSIGGEKKLITSVLEQQKSVLIFYRGGWCPFCNVHLAEVGQLAEEIRGLGYQIIAVSPDSPEKLKESVDKQSLEYQLYSDAGGELIKAMGLAFQAPENYGSMLSKASGDKNKGILPVSSLFITDVEGVILFEYVNPDYKQRISGKMLMAVLESLEK